MAKLFQLSENTIGLDIGESSLKACLLDHSKSAKGKKNQVLGVASYPSYGFLNGDVTHIGELSESIHCVLDELSTKSGRDIQKINVGIGGKNVDFRYSEAVIPLIDKGGREITEKDVELVQKNARLLGLKVDEDVLYDFPLEYVVDDDQGAVEPKGLYGRKLKVRSLVVVSRVSHLRNIGKAVHQAGYDIERVSWNPIEGACAATTLEERKQGCFYLEIGVQNTILMNFCDGQIKDISLIDFGSQMLSERLTDHLNISFDLAEEIKKFHIDLMATTHGDEEVLIKSEDAYVPIQRKQIYQALLSEINQFVFDLETKLHSSVIGLGSKCSLIFAGGGSLLSGLVDLVDSKLDIPCRLASIENDQISQKDLKTMMVPVFGLVKSNDQSAEGKNEHDLWYQKFSKAIQKLYHEYF